MEQQTTLGKAVSFSGIGLHSGRDVHMELRPAPAGTGIVFVRPDLPGTPRVAATADHVTSTLRATTIGADGIEFFTIEHLMSALHALSIDNCEVRLDAEEPPVADGAARVFFDLLESAGTQTLAAPRREVVIDRVYRIDDDKHERFVLAVPYDGFRVSFTSVNPHKLIGIQYEDFEITPELYKEEIAPARTIAYEKEIEQLHNMGLGLGGSIENVIVYNDDGWLNPLHFDDELVRHKIVDIIGDLRLAGLIRGHIIAAASGHALNTALAKKILDGCGCGREK